MRPRRLETDIRDEGHILNSDGLANVSGRGSFCLTLRVG